MPRSAKILALLHNQHISKPLPLANHRHIRPSLSEPATLIDLSINPNLLPPRSRDILQFTHIKYYCMDSTQVKISRVWSLKCRVSSRVAHTFAIRWNKYAEHISGRYITSKTNLVKPLEIEIAYYDTRLLSNVESSISTFELNSRRFKPPFTVKISHSPSRKPQLQAGCTHICLS